jgi:hypothetical protein
MTIRQRQTGFILTTLLVFLSALSLGAVAIADVICIQISSAVETAPGERLQADGTRDDNSLGCNGGGTCSGLIWAPTGKRVLTGDCVAVNRTR